MDLNCRVQLPYTNHRGLYSVRDITPKRFWYGSTEWHPEKQVLVDAFDHDKGEDRTFAVRDFRAATVSDTLFETLKQFKFAVDNVEAKAMACDGPVTPFLEELHTCGDTEKERFTTILSALYKHADAAQLDDRLENAKQAASETHSSWEARCHAILAALGFDFGDEPSNDAHPDYTKLLEIARAIEEWWVESNVGMQLGGAPNCIFRLREYLEESGKDQTFFVGPITIAKVFQPNDLQNLSNLQKVLDAVEVALVKSYGTTIEHGYVCYNAGPGSIFWSPERSVLEHELTDGLRPATGFEKSLFLMFGKPTPSGGYEIAEDHQEELKALELCLNDLKPHRYDYDRDCMDQDPAGEYVTYNHAKKVIKDVHEFAFRMDRFAKTYLRHMRNAEATGKGKPDA